MTVIVKTATVRSGIIARMDTEATHHSHHPHAEHPRFQRGGGAPSRIALGGGSLLHQVEHELRMALESQIAPFGITARQAALLLRAARGATSPNQLTSALGTDTAGMTRLLDRLESKGLVQRRRHPDDRRSVVIEVTPEGRALVPHLGPAFGSVAHQLMAGFSEEEVQQLTVLLQRMLDNLRATGTPPGAPPPTA